MVTQPSELEAVRALMNEIGAAFDREGVEYVHPPLGMMVEVPAAALSAASFDADFYSIGSNRGTRTAWWSRDTKSLSVEPKTSMSNWLSRPIASASNSSSRSSVGMVFDSWVHVQLAVASGATR